MGRGSSKISGSGAGGLLKPYGNEHYQTPFAMVDVDTGNEIARFNFRMGKYAGIGPVKDMNLPIETVPFADMRQNQAQLTRSKVDSLVKLSAAEIEGIRDSTTASDVPFVIKYNGIYQIQDGHHRLSALWAKGRKSAKVRVLDLDKL